MNPGGGDGPQSASKGTACLFSNDLASGRELRSPFRRNDGMSSILGVRRMSLLLVFRDDWHVS